MIRLRRRLTTTLGCELQEQTGKGWRWRMPCPLAQADVSAGCAACGCRHLVTVASAGETDEVFDERPPSPRQAAEIVAAPAPELVPEPEQPAEAPTSLDSPATTPDNI